MPAPICIFTYNRPEHTEKVLNALFNNYLASESTLYIYCDGAKVNATVAEKDRIKEVRKIVRKEKWCKNVIINESDSNLGLAESVIKGISEVLQKYDRIIVLEDDLITAPYFLTYMNDALEKYNNFENVMQISGYSFPVPQIKQENTCYFLPITSTWGWGTWRKVWEMVDFECKDYNPKSFDKKRFNFFNSYPYKKMLDNQLANNNKVNSWGIRFYYNVFVNNGIVLYPDRSLVKNIGWDKSGRHGASFQLYSSANWANEYQIKKYPEPILSKYHANHAIRYLKNENSLIIKIIKKIVAIMHG